MNLIKLNTNKDKVLHFQQCDSSQQQVSALTGDTKLNSSQQCPLVMTEANCTLSIIKKRAQGTGYSHLTLCSDEPGIL